MAKKVILLLLFIFGGTFTLLAQNLLLGKFIDENGLPIELLTVTASINDSLINGEITDTTGAFFFSLPNGEFTVAATLFGETLYDEEIKIDQFTDIGTVQVRLGVNLDEVTVLAQKKLIERKIDRLVFNVEGSMVSSGGNALDVLEVTPKIKVDDDKISMIGKSGMSVMVDDRLIQLSGEDLMTFLQSIKSEEIKSVEVITTPPAKYDAEGNSGMLNIKLKGLKTDSWNASLRTMYQQATYATGNIGVNLNYKKNKLTLSTGGSYTKGSTRRIETTDIFYPNSIWSTTLQKKIVADAFSSKLSLDYQIRPRWSIGGQYVLNISRPEVGEDNEGEVRNVETLMVDSIFNTIANIKNLRLLNDVNLYSKFELDTLGRKVSFNLSFFDYNNNTGQGFNTITTGVDGSSGINNQSKETYGTRHIQYYSGLVDVEHPTKRVNISYGIKTSHIKTENELKVYDLFAGIPTLNANQSNIFSFQENIQAIYLSGHRSFKDKFEIKVGLRGEFTQTEGYSKTLEQRNSNDYFALFPTFYLNYTPNKKHSLSLDYGRRISRPSYYNLNPFRFYTSAYNYSEGNPFLTPQYAHNIDLEYGFNHSLYVTLFYTHESDGIGQVPLIDESINTQYFTYSNYYTFEATGLRASYNFSELKWWENNTSVDIYYTESDFEKEIDLSKTSGWGMVVSSYNTFLLNAKGTFKGKFDVWGHTPQYELLFKLRARYYVNLGFQCSLLKNRNLKLSIQANDIFRTNRIRQTTFNESIEQTYSFYHDRRRVKFTLSYLLGNEKIRTRSKRSRNEEERRRIN